MMATTGADIHDVVIVGAGPAGATAAITLAAAGRSVYLIDAAKLPRRPARAGWLSARCKPLLADMGLSIKAVAAHEFKSVSFHNADLVQAAYPKFAGAPGYLVNRTDFDQRLVKAAIRAGAEFVDDRPVTDVMLEERGVSLTMCDADPVRGRLLVLAAGRESVLMSRIGLAIEAGSGGSWAAQVDTDAAGFKGRPRVSVILGLDQADAFGTVIAAKGFASVGIQTTAHREDVIPHLVTLCRMVAQAAILHVDLSRQAAATSVMMNPTAVALAMDTHVAKHTLIVGDAGGFVAAASGEGVYPAMWSARIACQVICKALDAESPQDVLMEFDTAWRTTMADYLRAPTTDTQFILPLIFTNQPMADRMAAAFFAGENI